MMSGEMELINKVLFEVEKLVQVYVKNPEDEKKANGNVAICIIDEDATIYGKIFGTDKIRGREAYRVAWIKASQVWITGIKTGEYEKLVFSGKIDEDVNGIRRPDYIGWEGGQPIIFNGVKLSIGFSGFRSVTDLEIVVKALSLATGLEFNNQSNNNYQLI